MFKDTCLVAHERIDQSPRTDHLEIPRTIAVLVEQNHLIARMQSINIQKTGANECIR
jgi:hypothetical protein